MLYRLTCVVLVPCGWFLHSKILRKKRKVITFTYNLYFTILHCLPIPIWLNSRYFSTKDWLSHYWRVISIIRFKHHWLSNCHQHWVSLSLTYLLILNLHNSREVYITSSRIILINFKRINVTIHFVKVLFQNMRGWKTIKAFYLQELFCFLYINSFIA